MAYRRNTFGLDAESGRMDSRSELRNLSRSARVGMGPNAPAKTTDWETPFLSFLSRSSMVGCTASERRREMWVNPTPTLTVFGRTVNIFVSIFDCLKNDADHEIGKKSSTLAGHVVQCMGNGVKVTGGSSTASDGQIPKNRMKHEPATVTQLTDNSSEPAVQTRIRARHDVPNIEVSLFFKFLAAKTPNLRTRPPHCTILPIASCSRQIIQTLVVPFPVRPNDDAAEKRLRRQVALELERRKEESWKASTPEAQEASDKAMNELGAGFERILDDLKNSSDTSVHSPRRLAIFVDCPSPGGTALEAQSEAQSEDQRLEDEVMAWQWDMWVKQVLDSMREPERQQVLRDWREQEEPERRWEAARGYADDLASSAADYRLPTSVVLKVLVDAYASGMSLPRQLYFNQYRPATGERLLTLKYPSQWMVFGSVSYDRGCQFGSAMMKNTLVNAERIESEWADCGLLVSDLLADKWRGAIIAGGLRPLRSVDGNFSSRTRGYAETGTGTVDVGYLEEIDEDILPELESADNSEDEGETEDEEERAQFRAKL
ncbi:hypothetical protein R3P38DRAFT_3180143 [Favolaschia claudopus]|uniref:Uncharacterized protein n=1 Tax=Favolaschia claudopus TaxID=2862362 RepID=A0AAW0CNI6_9AGAR